MDARTVAARAVTAVLIIFVLSMFLGQVLGQPILLSFVETGSMSPTLEPGDGFIAIPPGLAGPIEPGDVITWDAEQLNGGGLVTHRVVRETDQGFITQGDANPFTDQSSNPSEPPVQREQIVAVAWQVGGNLVVIPKIGLLVTGSQALLSGIQTRLAVVFGTRSLLGTQGLAYLLFAVGILAYLGSILLEQREGKQRIRQRERNVEVVNYTGIVLTLTVVLVALLTASMVVPGGTQQFGFVSSSSDAPGVGVIGRGQSENTTYQVPSTGVIPTVVFLEPTSEDIDVAPRELYIPGGSTANATVTLQAPPQTGYYRLYLVEHRYLAVLPQTTIRALYHVHPWAPILAIDLLLGGAFFGIAVGMVGLGRTRIRSRGRDIPLSKQIERWLR